MTKIRCQMCGGENLHTEGDITIICDDCGNKSYIIPEVSIENMDNPVDGDVVTIQYNRRKTGCPRRGICLNDTMNPGEEPCQICNVVRKNFNEITNQMVELFEQREEYLREHPELESIAQEMEGNSEETWS